MYDDADISEEKIRRTIVQKNKLFVFSGYLTQEDLARIKWIKFKPDLPDRYIQLPMLCNYQRGSDNVEAKITIKITNDRKHSRTNKQ